MFNSTWFVEISPMVNGFATLVQAFATIGLLLVTYWLYKATENYGNYAEKQTDIMSRQSDAIDKQTENYRTQTQIMKDQLGIAEKQIENSKHQSEIMEKQVKFGESQTNLMEGQVRYLKEQERIMKEQAERDISIEKYRRLRDEMDKFIAPLYFAAQNVKTTNDYNGSGGIFGLIKWESMGGRSEPQKAHYLFWVEIKKYIYLNQSERLFELLEKHFQYNDEFFKEDSEVKRNTFLMNRRELIPEITEKRYPQLKMEIENVEKDLAIRKSE